MNKIMSMVLGLLALLLASCGGPTREAQAVLIMIVVAL
jgi:hypothetical protein